MPNIKNDNFGYVEGMREKTWSEEYIKREIKKHKEMDPLDHKNGCVTDEKLAKDSVITEKIKDFAVTTNKINNAAVTTDKIANSAVTDTKIGSRTITDPYTDSGNVSNTLTGILNRITSTFRTIRTHLAQMKGAGKAWNATIAHTLPRRANKSQNVDFDNLAYHMNKVEVNGDDNDNQWMHGATTKPTAYRLAARTGDGAVETKAAANLEELKIDPATGKVTLDPVKDDRGNPKAISDVMGDYLPNATHPETGGYGMNAVNLATLLRHRHYKTLDHPDGSVTKEKLAKNSIVTDKIQDASITTSKIKDLAVTTSKINSLAVTTDKIANSAVTDTKIGNRTITDPYTDSGNISSTLTGILNRITSTFRMMRTHLAQMKGAGKTWNAIIAHSLPRRANKSQNVDFDNLAYHMNKTSVSNDENENAWMHGATAKPTPYKIAARNGQGVLESKVVNNLDRWEIDPKTGKVTPRASGNDRGNPKAITGVTGNCLPDGNNDAVGGYGMNNVNLATLLRHRHNNVLDHPDGSVTDNKIGSRTIDDPISQTNGIRASGVLTTLFNRVTTAIRTVRSQMRDMKGWSTEWNGAVPHKLPRRANKSQNVDFENLAYHMNKTSISNDENENAWMHGATAKPTPYKIAARNGQGVLETLQGANIENMAIDPSSGKVQLDVSKDDQGKPKAISDVPGDYLPHAMHPETGGYGMNAVNLANFLRHRHYKVMDHPDGSVTKEKLASLSVSEEKLATNAVTRNKIKDGEVINAKLNSAAVTANKIATNGLLNTSIISYTDPVSKKVSQLRKVAGMPNLYYNTTQDSLMRKKGNEYQSISGAELALQQNVDLNTLEENGIYSVYSSDLAQNTRLHYPKTTIFSGVLITSTISPDMIKDSGSADMDFEEAKNQFFLPNEQYGNVCDAGAIDFKDTYIDMEDEDVAGTLGKARYIKFTVKSKDASYILPESYIEVLGEPVYENNTSHTTFWTSNIKYKDLVVGKTYYLKITGNPDYDRPIDVYGTLLQVNEADVAYNLFYQRRKEHGTWTQWREVIPTADEYSKGLVRLSNQFGKTGPDMVYTSQVVQDQFTQTGKNINTINGTITQVKNTIDNLGNQYIAYHSLGQMEKDATEKNTYLLGQDISGMDFIQFSFTEQPTASKVSFRYPDIDFNRYFDMDISSFSDIAYCTCFARVGKKALDTADGVTRGTIDLLFVEENQTNVFRGSRAVDSVDGIGSNVAGQDCIASSLYSFAEGLQTTASGNFSHAEGQETIAKGEDSHAEGYATQATGDVSHAEGIETIASGHYSHVEGSGSEALGANSHAEGSGTQALRIASHAEGNRTLAQGNHSHAEGNMTKALSSYGHAEGLKNEAIMIGTHAEGNNTRAASKYGHTEGGNNIAASTLFDVAVETSGEVRKIILKDKNQIPLMKQYITAGEQSRYFYNYCNTADIYAEDRAEDVDTKEIHITAVNETTGELTCTESITSVDVICAYHVTIQQDKYNSYVHIEGSFNVAAGDSAHAEGLSNVAKGRGAHAEGGGTRAEGLFAHAEGYGTQAIFGGAHAEGWGTKAGGDSSHAEGEYTEASSEAAHAEGWSTIAGGSASHAEGYQNRAEGEFSHAEGHQAKASGDSSHAEGYKTKAAGDYTHAEGYNTHAKGWQAHTEGLDTIAYGGCSHAEGYLTEAGKESNADDANICAHAEGQQTRAMGVASHAEGAYTHAMATTSHAEGFQSNATETASHAEGILCQAEGLFAHAEGNSTGAYAVASHAEGIGTQAKSYAEHVQGQYNTLSTTSATAYVATANALVVGNGTSNSARGNAFRVTFNGNVYGKAAFQSTGADYAEYFEWADGNTDKEDRIGYFVTIENGKIKKASASDSYLLGVVSANASVIGNAYEDTYHGMYEVDEWGRIQYEWVEVPAEYTTVMELDENGKQVEKQVEISPMRRDYVPKISSTYDPAEEYIPRSQRPEWDTIGMMGQLLVRDDGTCRVDGYCACADGGIATASESGYRVVERVSETIVRILL